MKRVKYFLSITEESVYTQMESPVGLLTLIASKKGLQRVLWEKESLSKECQNVLKKLKQSQQDSLLKDAKKQLKAYFNGELKVFKLPLDVEGTNFQKQAWKELSHIPYGETISYKEQATRLGDSKKARAVGLANGLNPISIIVPCHRVIGSNGSLTGFGGGVENKALLLNLEKNKLYFTL